MKRKTPKVIKAKNTGFCFGVKRAIAAAEGLLNSHANTCSLGPIIHNPFVVEELAKKGLRVISDIKQAKGACLVVRSHGIPPALKEKADKYCKKILDTTCPFVARSQEIVSRLRREGYRVAIAGEGRHPEVQALVEMAGPGTLVLSRKSDIKNVKRGQSKLALIAQTTISRDSFMEIAKALLGQSYPEFRVFDTICNDVVGRQKEAKQLSLKVDIVCVVGGKDSANTRHLVQICRKNGAPAYHIESSSELKPRWFKNAKKVGVVSGASTPGYIVDKVSEKIKNIIL